MSKLPPRRLCSAVLRDLRCVEGRLMRHDPQCDDPYLETDVGTCPDCDGRGCEED